MTPPSTSVMTLKEPVRVREIAVVNAIVARPATSAAACTPIRFQSSSSAMTAPTHVPAATPKVSGVARGLEKSDWNEAPATDRPPPIRIATMMRGARRSNTTELTRGGTAAPPQNLARSAATTSSRDTEKRPISMAATAHTTMRATSVGITHARSRPFLVSTDFMMSSPRRTPGVKRIRDPGLVDRGDEAGARYQDAASGLTMRWACSSVSVKLYIFW